MNFNFIIKSGGYEVKITKTGVFIVMRIIAYLFLILPLMLISACDSGNNVQNSEEPTSVVKNKPSEEEKIEIESLHFDESELEIDIKETKEIILKVSPNNAEIESLEYRTSDEKIASLEKTNIKDDKSEIALKIKPNGEGNCEIFAKAKNGIESNKVTLKIIDKERINAEEQAKKEVEEKAKKEAEDKAKQQTTKSSSATQASNSSGSASSSGTKQKSNANNSHGKAIYCTPHGKRYHYDPDCGGKNSRQTTWEYAKSIGLTPCQKCVH